jgi:DNA-binding GntR family transcriptional regulator
VATSERRTEISRKTMSDAVAERLRAEILCGDIQPGERIVVARLERRFGVSHIPIREALRRLEVEGLVEISPQRSTIATGVALHDLTDLYALRRLVEGELAALATEGRSEEQLEELRSAHRAMEAVETSADPDAGGFWDLHHRFHWAILTPASNPWVRRIVEQLWQSAERYVRLHLSAQFAPVEESVRQHRGLLEACERRDPLEVKALLCEHLTTTEKDIREGYLAMQRARAA